MMGMVMVSRTGTRRDKHKQVVDDALALMDDNKKHFFTIHVGLKTIHFPIQHKRH